VLPMAMPGCKAGPWSWGRRAASWAGGFGCRERDVPSREAEGADGAFSKMDVAYHTR